MTINEILDDLCSVIALDYHDWGGLETSQELLLAKTQLRELVEGIIGADEVGDISMHQLELDKKYHRNKLRAEQHKRKAEVFDEPVKRY